jgi:hypothetical protein
MRLTNKTMAFSGALALVALGGAFLAGRAFAGGIPAAGALAYSGRLEDASGTPLSGSRNLQIIFWNAKTAGAKACETPSAPVELSGGRFTIALPETCTNSVKAAPDLWVEILVDGSALPRTKVGAVPYAVESAHAVNADNAANLNNPASGKAVRICSGSTPAGSTTWAVYATDAIKVTVDISVCKFTSKPVILSVLAGRTSHWITTGGSNPYVTDSATSFDIYVKNTADITPAVANERAWHVEWTAIGN